MARRRLAASAAIPSGEPISRQKALIRRIEAEERRALSAASNGNAVLGQGPPDPPPVTDPKKLEIEWSSAPTISQWIARMFQGEIAWPEIMAMQKSAELGLVDQWADFTRRMYKSDDTILSCMMTYVGAVSGARREVAPREGIPSLLADIASDQAQACAMLLDNMPNVERSIAEMIDGDFVGWAGHEIIWEPIGEWIYPTELRWLHPDRFRFSQHFKPYLWDRGLAMSRARELGLNTDSADGMGIPLVGNKYIVHMPRMIPDYPQGSGLLYGCVRYWFVKNWCTKFALAGAETAGVPRMLGHVMNSAPPAVRDALYEALGMLSADGVGVIGEGTSIEILDPKMQGNGSIWDFLLKRADAGLTKAILGSTLNVEVGDTGGNRALGESQASMTISPRWARSGQLIANTLESQLFRPFLEMNRHVWGGHVFVPNLTFHIVEDEPEVDQLVVDRGACSWDELRRSRKLPAWGKEKGGDERIPAVASSADANIYKAQLALDPSAIPPNDADPVAAVPDVAAPTPKLPADATPAPAAAAAPDVAASAFNGAQVTSLVTMLASVKDGSLAPEAAIIAITIAFPSVTGEQSRAMVSAQTPGATPAPAPTAPPGGAAAGLPFGPKTATRRTTTEAQRMVEELLTAPSSRRS